MNFRSRIYFFFGCCLMSELRIWVITHGSFLLTFIFVVTYGLLIAHLIRFTFAQGCVFLLKKMNEKMQYDLPKSFFLVDQTSTYSNQDMYINFKIYSFIYKYVTRLHNSHLT